MQEKQQSKMRGIVVRKKRAKNIKLVVLNGIFLSLSMLAKAQNPICPPGVYLADPSARSWNDSTLYLYTSTDSSCEFWCSWRHDILFTTDMENWQVEENVFTSKGLGDQLPYNDNLLYAPDCTKKDDSYIMYYCQPDKTNALGTAISTSPTGPFVSGQKLEVGKENNHFDPSVFIDDDGTPYIVWGQFNLRMAILKPDMRTIDSTTIRDRLLTRSEHYFHEGAYLTKRNGTYYLVFADESRNQTPSCIAYATSDKPFGPYKYGGVIIDNSGCNPDNWNNHGSIFEFKDQWYVFYHRSTNGCRMYRKSCVEKIRFLSDGSIPEVEMTSQGASDPLDATRIIEAEWACKMNGNVRIEGEGEKNEKLGQMKNGDQAIFKYLNFKKGVSSITIRSKCLQECNLSIYVGKGKEEELIAELDLSQSDESSWREDTFTVQNADGIGSLTFKVAGGDGYLCDIDWFQFSK